MKKNVGSLDRVIRIILALMVGVLIYLKIIVATPAIIIGIIAIVLILTSLVEFCPMYMPFKISTRKK